MRARFRSVSIAQGHLAFDDFTFREVTSVLVGELALLTLFAIPLGLLIGSGLGAGIVTAASNETVRLPLVLSGRSYSTAVLIVPASSAASFAVVSMRLHKLNLRDLRGVRGVRGLLGLLGLLKAHECVHFII